MLIRPDGFLKTWQVGVWKRFHLAEKSCLRFCFLQNYLFIPSVKPTLIYLIFGVIIFRMRKITIISFGSLYLSVLNASAQILCVLCYNQNDSLSDNINNLLLNGGFENSTCTPHPSSYSNFCPNSNVYAGDINNWTCSGGGFQTYTLWLESPTFSEIVEGNNAVYFGNRYCNACSSSQNDTSCLSEINCYVLSPPSGFPVNLNIGYGGDTGVSLSQTVNDLTIGSIYVIEFWAGGEGDENSYTKNGLFAADVGFGNIFLRCNSTPVGGIGKRYIIQFIANQTSHTIKFTNWGHICQDCTELVLDNVRLYTLAEISNYIQPCYQGISNSVINETSIFPNPTITTLTIQSPLISKTTTLSTFNAQGQQVFAPPLQQEDGQVALYIGHLASGVYFLTLSNEGQTVSKRFVKE